MRDALARLPLVGGIAAPTSQCTSVPFSADLPNMVLSVTAGLAVSVFVVFNLRLRLLRGDLEASGLVSAASLDRSGLGAALAAGLPRRRRDVLVDAGLALLSIVGSAAMYYWLYTHGPIFRDLAGSYRHMGSTDVTTEMLRQNWWANHETHPFNTALGIAVGAVGLFFALKQRSVFVLIGRWLRTLRTAPRPVEFVPKWLDRDYGWRPVKGPGVARVPGRLHVPGLVLGRSVCAALRRARAVAAAVDPARADRRLRGRDERALPRVAASPRSDACSRTPSHTSGPAS